MNAQGVMTSATLAVQVEAPSRLHLGFLDPSASLGRRFASLGLVLDGFPTRIAIAPATHDSVTLNACGEDADRTRILAHLARLRRETGFDEPLAVSLEAAPPAHSGFGSGTQLALALGRAFCAHHGLEVPARRIAAMLGRGERSGVGIAGFDHGGLILDGGPSPDGQAAPMLARVAFPSQWRILVVLDARVTGLCGSAERVAMDCLAPFPRARAADLCHQVLMRILPGAMEADFAPFAEGISTVQSLIGDYFAPAQGGSMYTSAAVARLLEWIRPRYTAGIGQSSWGPTGFAIMRSAAEAEAAIAAAIAEGVVDSALKLVVARARNSGATCSETLRRASAR